ncbi:MAG: hypothetical protein WAS73_01315 [Defluviicoccus sp.]
MSLIEPNTNVAVGFAAAAETGQQARAGQSETGGYPKRRLGGLARLAAVWDTRLSAALHAPRRSGRPGRWRRLTTLQAVVLACIMTFQLVMWFEAAADDEILTTP